MKRKKQVVKWMLYSLLIVTMLTGWLPENTVRVKATAYDAQAAINYARQYANGRNPQYADYGDNDCSNFVSQCLAAGGLSQDSAWNPNAGVDPQTGYNNWRTTALKDYLINKGYPVIWNPSADQILPGNPVFYSTRNDYATSHTGTNHAAICVSNEGNNPLICAHSNDHLDYPHAYMMSYYKGCCTILLNGSYVPPAPDISNPGAPYAIPSGNIGSGSSGDGIRWIQTALNNLMGAGLAVDGIFGAGTKNAVVQFQSANGLAADGVVGNDTRNKMVAVWRAKQDTVQPAISNVKVSNKFSTGYVVECDVSDNVGVTKIQFPTWTAKNDQDDLKWVDAVVSNGHAQVNINISDHNYETGPYITHIYAWDVAGNQAFAAAGTIFLPQITDGALQNPGESFVAQITIPGSKALLQSGDKIIAAGLQKGNKAQQWKFTRNSDGTYFISNLGNNKNMDVYGAIDANGTNVWTYSFNGSDAQKWYIYKNKSGDYYFAPKLSKYRVMDRASSSGQMHLWDFYGDANAAQLFDLSMVVESTPVPVATKVPTESPNYTNAPVRTEKPESTEAPIRTEKPVYTEQPLISSVPENPVRTEQPSKTKTPEFPARTEQPTVTTAPSVSQKPIATERPWSTQMPEETDTGNQEANDIGNQENNAMDEEDDYYHISKKPLQVRNLSLKNKKNRKLIVRWKKVSGVSGYQIQCARNKKFTVKCITKKISSNKAKSMIHSLQKGKKYFVRIRSYKQTSDGKLYSRWSKVKKLTIKK